MPPITGHFELDLITQWRIALQTAWLTTSRVFVVSLVIIACLTAWRTSSSEFLPFAVVSAVLGMCFIYPFTLAAGSLVLTAIARATATEGTGPQTILINDDGVRLTRQGRDSLIPWRSLAAVRKIGRTLLLRTDHWVGIPEHAFRSPADFREAYAMCVSLRGTSRTMSIARPVAAPAPPTPANAYLPPREVVAAQPAVGPARGPDVLVRVTIPPTRLSFSGMTVKLVRHRPQSALGLIVAILMPMVLFRLQVGIISSAIALTFVFWRRNAARKTGMAGLPEIIDLTEQGVSDWEAMREVQFGWQDVICAAEEAEGFFLMSRGGEYLFLPNDCVEGGAANQVREVLRSHLGTMARLAPATY
jgi:hypothetical protein